MTTQHTGNEEEEIQCAESAQETGQNTEQSADDLNSEESEHDEPEPAEGAMERSLPAPTPFNTDASDLYSEWKHWVSAFEICSIASGLSKKEDDVQRATLLHCLGPTVQRIFNMLLGEHKSFQEVKTALDGYFAPKRNVVAERYKFRSRGQRADEPIDTYLMSLRELVKSCDFGTLEEEMIRDQIVEKCASKTLRQKLLQQEKLDLARTVKLARSEENATQDSLLISSGTKENPIQIDRVHNNQKEPAKTAYVCYRCGGKDGHSANECRAINSRCNNCKKIGHLQKVCRSKPKGADSNSSQNRQRQRPPKKCPNERSNKVRNLRTWLDESSGDDENEPVLSFNNADSSITVKLNGQRTKMIVDTGCKYNIISSALHRSQFRNFELYPTEKRFTAYGQKEPLQCKGYFNASIRTNNNVVNAKVYVIAGNAESLLGRDSSFKLNVLTQVNSVNRDSTSELDSLLKEYSDIFEGLGRVNNFEHKITIDPEVKPISQHLRRIPVSQVEAVNNELDRMLEPSPWVSNLVIVPSHSSKKVGRLKDML